MNTAVSLFPQVRARLKTVAIDNRDFAKMIALYQRPRTLFYVDPPYLNTESYYGDETALFTRNDHERLASALAKATRIGAKVALSYYACPELDEWYPASQWHRIAWDEVKRSQRGKRTMAKGHEVLLTNYAPSEDGTA